MNFVFPWLLWRRAARKQQQKLDKVVEKLSNDKVIQEIAERDPEFKENLRTLGVKTDDRCQ